MISGVRLTVAEQVCGLLTHPLVMSRLYILPCSCRCVVCRVCTSNLTASRQCLRLVRKMSTVGMGGQFSLPCTIPADQLAATSPPCGRMRYEQQLCSLPVFSFVVPISLAILADSRSPLHRLFLVKNNEYSYRHQPAIEVS